MAEGKSKIIYTLTDEAPLLATCAFLPIIRTFTGPAGIEIEKSDISVSARMIAEFSDMLPENLRMPNTLSELGAKCLLPETNIIKLPNISASVAQLKACIKELQGKGYPLPDYPEAPATDEEKSIAARYGKCLGSSVNPVLREGKSGHQHQRQRKKAQAHQIRPPRPSTAPSRRGGSWHNMPLPSRPQAGVPCHS